MFNNLYDVIWGTIVPFDKPEKGLYMVYYGVYIKGVFLGISFLTSKYNLKSKPRDLKISYHF